jgi:hypothetical protein
LVASFPRFWVFNRLYRDNLCQCLCVHFRAPLPWKWWDAMVPKLRLLNKQNKKCNSWNDLPLPFESISRICTYPFSVHLLHLSSIRWDQNCARAASTTVVFHPAVLNNLFRVASHFVYLSRSATVPIIILFNFKRSCWYRSDVVVDGRPDYLLLVATLFRSVREQLPVTYCTFFGGFKKILLDESSFFFWLLLIDFGGLILQYLDSQWPRVDHESLYSVPSVPMID